MNQSKYEILQKEDPEIWAGIQNETKRQQNTIELIASENIVSEAVMEAMGSPLTNKYAEGYPNKRYYGGCEYIDKIEQLAIDRAKRLFGCEFANVQPHSGTQANMAVYQALLKPGDTVLAMDLQSGGHLSHFSPMSQSGKLYKVITYGLNDEGFIDYNQLRKLALEHKPRLILAGASAYSRYIDFLLIRNVAAEVNNKIKEEIDNNPAHPEEWKENIFEENKCYFMVDMAHIAGLVAAGLHPSPVDCADVVTTTTHKTLRGPRGGLILWNDESLTKKINSAVFPNIQGGPLEHIIAAKAVCFKEALEPEFKIYQEQILRNTAILAETLADNGFDLVSNGTDNHLILIDLRRCGMTGLEAQQRLEQIGIATNKNSIPNDPQKPTLTSGLRLGCAAITSRGFIDEEVKVIGEIIANCLIKHEFSVTELQLAVRSLCEKHPIY